MFEYKHGMHANLPVSAVVQLVAEAFLKFGSQRVKD